MGTIRKQAIYSSIVIYLGFLIGFVNTWFFIRNGSFTPDQYALTRLFFDVGQMMYAFGGLGVVAVIYKFFPYYQDHLTKKENDLYSWSLLTVFIGFTLVIAAGILFEPLIIRKFSERSPLFVNYYHWVFLFGFGITVFSVLEIISGTFKKTILPNFLKEAGLRFLTFGLILLFFFKIIDFDRFIKLFAFLYILLAIVLFAILYRGRYIHLVFKESKVTRRFKKKMISLSLYIYVGQVIQVCAAVADSIFIASLKGLALTGVFSLASYIANLIQVPQRSVISITLPALSKAWKDKNLKEIDRIYHRTSINLLLIGLFIFGSVWLNIQDAFITFNIQSEYKAGLSVVFILGITRIIDAGTGVNAQIIGTSTQWRFEFLTGVILLALLLPLNYFLIKQYGIIGSAYSNLIAFTVYNLIRLWFLWYKYKLQPFNSKTVLSLLLASAAYFVCLYLFQHMSGWMGIILRSSLFTVLFTAGVFILKLTPDAHQLLEVVKKRLGIKAD
ncbi:MAG: polysaccharide biosynthesis C-terminal domain-containing protein [Chitinophagaceae bacterium]|nr:polysaccharide biosynthesis C-terminal domain-containing protein [Chitinophagaceae bacterium]